jgi:hypothetical protein
LLNYKKIPYNLNGLKEFDISASDREKQALGNPNYRTTNLETSKLQNYHSPTAIIRKLGVEHDLYSTDPFERYEIDAILEQV